MINILRPFRGIIIKRLRKNNVGSQMINHILDCLGLRPTGLRDFKNHTPSPKVMSSDLDSILKITGKLLAKRS